MFGYVTVNKPELKIREYERYHSFYCGLCHTLKKRHGQLGQLTLTYDMTFLVIVLSSLYEAESTYELKRCIVHPVKKHGVRTNRVTNYAADMNIALFFHKCFDDWKDEKSIRGISGMRLLHRHYKEVKRAYPQKCRQIEAYLQELSRYEAMDEQNLDKTAGAFGKLMGTLFDYKQDIWSPYLKRFGFYLGKFIYIMDAVLDFEEDKKNGHYTPLRSLSQSLSEADFRGQCRNILELMIAAACQEFEKLPLEQDVELLRNILYAGVWRRYEQHTAQYYEKNNRKDKS